MNTPSSVPSSKPCNQAIIQSLKDRLSTFSSKQKKISGKSSADLLETIKNEDKSPELTSLDHEYIIKQVENMEETKNYYAEGFNAKIFLVEVPSSKGQEKLLIVKEQLVQDKKSNSKILHEYGFYVDAYKTIQNSNSLVSIPKVYGVLNDKQSNMMIIMKFIPGMTVFGLKISLILPKLYEKFKAAVGENKAIEILGPESNYNKLTTDTRLKEAMLNILDAFYRHGQNDFYEEHLSYFSKYKSSDFYGGIRLENQMANTFDSLSKILPMGFLDEKEITTIKDHLMDNISLLNENQIFHNDMNQRNLIIGENGKIYIIDFDKAGKEIGSMAAKAAKNKDPKYVHYYKNKAIEGDYRALEHFTSFIKTNEQ